MGDSPLIDPSFYCISMPAIIENATGELTERAHEMDIFYFTFTFHLFVYIFWMTRLKYLIHKYVPKWVTIKNN